MRAIRINDFKNEPRLEETPLPIVGPIDVLVQVEAASLNPRDVHPATRSSGNSRDIRYPRTPGTDFAGKIVKIGSAVRRWRVGDRVIAWTDTELGGGLADFAVADESACVAMPGNITAVHGAAIPSAGITAWHSLFSTAKLKPRETVLVHGADGGTGSFAVQFACLAGARVIATASEEGLTLVRNLGANVVIDHAGSDFCSGMEKVDVVLDLAETGAPINSHRILKTGGRLVSTAMAFPDDAAGIRGAEVQSFSPKPFANRLGDLVSIVSDLKLKVTIDRVTPILSFRDAWERQRSGKARGQIVVVPQ